MEIELMKKDRLSLVEGRLEHADYLKDNLRIEDIRECYIHGMTPEYALTDPFDTFNAVTYTLKFDDEVIAMCGTVPVDSKTARVWMLGSSSIEDNFMGFLRGCKRVINLLQAQYESIENYVPVDHEHTIMWLQWCGFQVDTNMYEVSGHTMVRFVRCINSENNVYYLTKRPVTH
tara:strand:+ start:14758 stop:15279 length:522 start_codon:yes stop_codon:yes gene_type:complete